MKTLGDVFGAVRDNNRTELKRLISAGANVNVRDKYRQAPLHTAAFRGHTTIAKIIIAAGANVNVRSKYGGTPLDVASFYGRATIVRLLKAAGAKLGPGK